MRRLRYVVGRGVCVVVLAAVAGSIAAAPEGGRDPREKQNPVKRVILKIVRGLGDALVIPRP